MTPAEEKWESSIERLKRIEGMTDDALESLLAGANHLGLTTIHSRQQYLDDWLDIHDACRAHDLKLQQPTDAINLAWNGEGPEPW